MQGALFRKFRDQIMNIDPSTTTTGQDHRSVLEKDEVDVSTSKPSADEGWNIVHRKRARTSVEKRDHMTTSNKVVIMSNNLIK
jgi:hypothetical protein